MNALSAHPARPTTKWRDPRSHVTEDGYAKVTYQTEAEARAAARSWHTAPYLCNQNPNHWHLTGAQQ